VKEKREFDFDFPENYHSSQSLNKDLESLCEKNSDLLTRHHLGKSTEGKEIWCYIISSKQSALETIPASLIIGCHHGRECITSEAAYYGMKYLLENHSANEKIHVWIEHSAIIFVPMLNPDGHDVINRKNGNEVDLNRNYTFNWGIAPGCSHDPTSEIYCGPNQLSEIESQLVNKMKIIDELFLKYKNIKCSLDMHSGATLLLYPWGYSWDPTPDNAVFETLCQQMEQQAREMQVEPFPSGPGISLYPTSGTYIDHVYQFYHCISYVLELYKGRWAGSIWEFFNPPSEQVEPVCHRVLPVIFTLIDYATKI